MDAKKFLNRYKNGQRNFRGADLPEIDLLEIFLDDGVDLSEANLVGLVIRKADLTRIKLIRANLQGADLSKVNLS